MIEQATPIQKPSEPLVLEQFSGLQIPYEIVKGVGVSLGLTLFWILEKSRDGIFHLLDRMNVKPRVRRASAFPPGRAPRKRQVVIHR
ncbi:MAG TPA: hypothetical protein VHY56_01275 [Candidatus Binataceae bacterium]|nr:hypothetical protein [Candidatus Binataceae bacterium]